MKASETESRPAGQRRSRAVARRRSLVVVTMAMLALQACAQVPTHRTLPDLPATDLSFRPTVEAYAEAPAIGGNRVTLLQNGDEIFPAQLAAIRSARETITYAQYFYEKGSIGLEMAQAFAERCRNGVRTHILLDGFGTLGVPQEYKDLMKTAGCEVAIFRPLHPLVVLSPFGFGKGNRRNHRRVLVVDGRVGFTGGVGVSEAWLGDGHEKDHWRQTDVRIEGPVVASLQGSFVENWLEATGNVLGGAPYFPAIPAAGKVKGQIIRGSPTGGRYTMYTSLLLAIVAARRSITVTNPYFLPDERMMNEMIEAARRGVRVRILLPGPIDNSIVRHASRTHFGELMAAGIEIYEYKPGLLHAKTMTVDGVWATIGSANFDSRSFALNEELNLVVYDDREVVGRLERIFADDLTYSNRVTEETWKQRGVFGRFFEVLSLPVHDQL
jgi:cardiolipin synthase A/B